MAQFRNNYGEVLDLARFPGARWIDAASDGEGGYSPAGYFVTTSTYEGNVTTAVDPWRPAAYSDLAADGLWNLGDPGSPAWMRLANWGTRDRLLADPHQLAAAFMDLGVPVPAMAGLPPAYIPYVVGEMQGTTEAYRQHLAAGPDLLERTEGFIMPALLALFGGLAFAGAGAGGAAATEISAAELTAGYGGMDAAALAAASDSGSFIAAGELGTAATVAPAAAGLTSSAPALTLEAAAPFGGFDASALTAASESGAFLELGAAGGAGLPSLNLQSSAIDKVFNQLLSVGKGAAVTAAKALLARPGGAVAPALQSAQPAQIAMAGSGLFMVVLILAGGAALYLRNRQ